MIRFRAVLLAAATLVMAAPAMAQDGARPWARGDGGDRAGWSRGGRGPDAPPPAAVAPQAPAPGQGEARRDWGRRDGDAARPQPRPDGQRDWRGRDDGRGRADNAGQNRAEWRDRQQADRRDWNDRDRDGRRDWNDRARDDRRDWNNSRSWADRRDWNGGDRRAWDRRDGDRRNLAGWRNDGRYDWRSWRARNAGLFRGPRYVAPRGYGYRPFAVGYRLDPFLYGSDTWLADPWSYHLPPADGPYRWVRYFNDVLLVDLRTGAVADSIQNFFW